MADDTYERALERDARDLVKAAAAGKLPECLGREAEVGALLAELDAGRSALLVGPAGAGKSAVLHGAARALAARGKGRLLEVSTSTVMSGTRYLGEWESKITMIARSAASARAAIYFSDIWALDIVGRTSNSSRTVLDALRPYLEAGQVTLVGEVTLEQHRAMQRSPHFAELFRRVAVEPLSPAQVDAVLERAAAQAGLGLDAACRRALVDLTGRFLPSRPQPGPALTLLSQVKHYRGEKEKVGEEVELTEAFVERVFAIYTGLPLFVVSRSTTRSAAEIRAWFEERIVGQREAIAAVVQAIALFKSGLNDPLKPLSTFLFVGPTGVGKTELARALATYLFGSPQRLLRFDLSEFKANHSFEILLGSPREPERGAALLDPVRAQPFQVLLFDELEKAHDNIWDLLLPLLDEGRLTPPGGAPVDFRRTIIICTSNVGAAEAQKAMGFGAGDPRAAAARIRQELERTFRPELLARFQHVVPFHALRGEEVREVARRELRRILDRDGLTSRGLTVDVDGAALDHIVERGFDARWGARALKREIESSVVLPLALALLERPVERGQILKVTCGPSGGLRVEPLDDGAARSQKRARLRAAPVKAAQATRTGILAAAREARQRVEEIARGAGRGFLEAERGRLTELRSEPAFWRFPADSARALHDLETTTAMLERLDRLAEQAEGLEKDAAGAGARTRLQALSRRRARLEQVLDDAELELVHLGRAGAADALVELRPLGARGREARDLLAKVYAQWARSKGGVVETLREPLEEDEPAWLGIAAPFAFGLLRLEAGLHRVGGGSKRPGDGRGEGSSVARVRVAAWDPHSPAGSPLARVVALKRTGAWGGKIRSRWESADGMVLQNGCTIAENGELAGRVSGSWSHAPPPLDVVVRRYDLDAPLVRDALTDSSSGHPDALGPERFDRLLRRRVLADRMPDAS